MFGRLTMSYQLIGKITGLKGLKGEMKVKALSGFMLERLQPGKTLYLNINNSYKPYIVKSYHENQKHPLLVLKGYENINQVQAFNKAEIFVDSNEELDLEDHVYMEDDLIGLDVYQGKTFKGKVIGVKNYPMDDYLLVKTNDKNVLIPFRDEFIVDMDEMTIKVVEMEGLF
jgi:16S rRNA processing protein RimM